MVVKSRLDREVICWQYWNLDEIVGDLIRFRHEFGDTLDIDDGDAWASFVGRLETQQHLLFLKHQDNLVRDGARAATVP